jgi:hypothetical protein
MEKVCRLLALDLGSHAELLFEPVIAVEART